MPDLNTSAPVKTDVQALQQRASQPTARRNIPVINRRNDQLDKSSFLKLLVKQLEHQDPLQPVSDREFIAQMAQFSSLEQMQNVARSMDSLKSFQANFLVGRSVTGRDFVTGRDVKGLVDQVLFDSNNQVFLRVGGRRIKFSDLTSITAHSQAEQQSNKIVPKQYSTELTSTPPNTDTNHNKNKTQTNETNIESRRTAP